MANQRRKTTRAAGPAAKAPAPPVPATRAPNAALRAAAQIIDAQKLLLRAGLRVLRVGGEAEAPTPATTLSMEEVFDRRVAGALQRLGMPDAADLARLARRLEALEQRFDALIKPARKKAPHKAPG